MLRKRREGPAVQKWVVMVGSVLAVWVPYKYLRLPDKSN
jgi:hypothetical protein